MKFHQQVNVKSSRHLKKKQVINENLPQFQPKISKTQIFPICDFSYSLCSLLKAFATKRFETLKIEQTEYAVCYFAERVVVLCFKSASELTLMSWKSVSQKSFSCKVSKFSRSFNRWKNEIYQQRTNAISSMLFEGQLQFYVREEPPSDQFW